MNHGPRNPIGLRVRDLMAADDWRSWCYRRHKSASRITCSKTETLSSRSTIVGLRNGLEDSRRYISEIDECMTWEKQNNGSTTSIKATGI